MYFTVCKIYLEEIKVAKKYVTKQGTALFIFVIYKQGYII